MTVIPRTYLAIGASIALIVLLIGAWTVGYRAGSRSVHAAWDREKAAVSKAQLAEAESALVETRRLAKSAAEQAKADLDAAIKASEERQAARVTQAVRSAAIDAATRRGAYVAPECRLDEATYQTLQQQLKMGAKK